MTLTVLYTQTTYTHHAPNSQSRLDRFYVNPTSVIQNHVFIPTPFSDHDLITLSIAVPSPTNHKTNHPWKNNINTYKIIVHQTQLSNVINNEMQSDNRSNPLQKWLTTKNKIRILLKTQARNVARQKTLENIKTQQKLYKHRDAMTANPNTENLKNYNSYRKHLHDQFLKDARCNLLKHEADLEEFQNIFLNHLYKQLTHLPKIPNYLTYKYN